MDTHWDAIPQQSAVGSKHLLPQNSRPGLSRRHCQSYVDNRTRFTLNGLLMTHALHSERPFTTIRLCA